MSFKVRTDEYLGKPRNHIGISVETDPDKNTRRIFHVVGSIVDGMKYETRLSGPHDEDEGCNLCSALIGHVEPCDMGRFEEVCKAVEVPGAQVGLDGKRKDSTEPVRRDTDWTAEVVHRLLSEGIVAKWPGWEGHDWGSVQWPDMTAEVVARCCLRAVRLRKENSGTSSDPASRGSRPSYY